MYAVDLPIQKDRVTLLGKQQGQGRFYKQSFRRNNLFYQVIQTEDILGKLLQILKKLDDSCIIYTNSRKQTENICSFLVKQHLRCSFYHGGLSLAEKNNAYHLWMTNKTPVMVATNAFGMGIDKPDVRAVIHINIPLSIENFIQESGRAGRDVVLQSLTSVCRAGQPSTHGAPGQVCSSGRRI